MWSSLGIPGRDWYHGFAPEWSPALIWSVRVATSLRSGAWLNARCSASLEKACWLMLIPVAQEERP